MASKKDCTRNTKFNGNKYRKDPDGQSREFFCKFVQSKETGVHLALLRTGMGYSRQEFVDFLEKNGYLRISLTTLWKWESGRGKIGDEEIKALCVALKCSRDELVVYEEREIGDEHDQPVHIIKYIVISIDECLQTQMLVFFVNWWLIG